MKREDKREVVADLQQQMRQAKVAILTRFSGLNVERMTLLRRELRKADVEYRIIKNTLFRLAIQGTDKEVLTPNLTGPIGIAWSDTDPVGPAKILAKYAKDFAELQILVAASDGRLWDTKAKNKLSNNTPVGRGPELLFKLRQAFCRIRRRAVFRSESGILQVDNDT